MLIDDYLALIHALLHGEIAIEAFERRYLKAFKSETRAMSPEVFQTLDRLFAAVDAYCGDPDMRAEEDLDEAGLRAEAREAREALMAHERRWHEDTERTET